jgi:tetratricopeptide (TPR) repeat protein
MCGRKDNDKGFVLVGEPQIHDSLANISDADVKIAVVHHPFDWLEVFDCERVERELQNKFDFILCGHTHKPRVRNENGTHGKCVLISTGAGYDKRIADDLLYINSYNFVHFDCDTGKVAVFLRRWRDERKDWTEDSGLADNGQFLITHPKFISEFIDKSLLEFDNFESKQNEKSSSTDLEQIENREYIDQVTNINEFDIDALNIFRTQLRDDILRDYPNDLSHSQFLIKSNLMLNGYLTRTGILMFGSNPSSILPSAITQCFKYHGKDKAAPRERNQLNKSIPKQINDSIDFIASKITKTENPVAGQAKSAIEYEYPMICVREIIVNALTHRDYQDNYRVVHISIFSDRIEISSPGSWFGESLSSSTPYKLEDLKSRSIKRNITLANVLSWARIVEGEGSGIPTAIADCKKTNAPLPSVIQEDGFVTVTIWPSRKDKHLIPHQIPSPSSDFKGREYEINEILADFQRGATITGLRGMGGIGKTALALVLAKKLENQFPSGQLFIDLHGTSITPLSHAEAMAQVIRAYNPTERLPENQNELRGMYLSLMANKRILLLLDNAASREQVEGLLPPTGNAVLITSRNKFTLPGLKEKDLDILPPRDACELLLEIAPRIGNRAGYLADLCGYLPLALRNAASAIAEKRDLPISEYERRLRDKMARLELVEASFCTSYDLLTPRKRSLWCRLSVFPEDFDRKGAAAVFKMSQDASDELLSDLVQWSLVDYISSTDSKDDRYRLHDLARIFAESRLDSAERDDAHQRHAKHYLDVLLNADLLYKKGGKNILAGLALFDREWVNIKAGQAWAECIIRSSRKSKKTDGEKLAFELANYYPSYGFYVLELRLHPKHMIHWHETALKAARGMKFGSAEGVHLGNLGLAYADLGETRKAIEYYNQSLEIDRRFRNKKAEGVHLGSLGRAYADLGETITAIKYYDKALEIDRSTGEGRAEGVHLSNLGRAYADLGDTIKAIEYYGQALKVIRKIGDRRGESASLGNLGLSYADRGELRKAIKCYTESLEIAQKIGDRRGEGANLGNLGSAHAHLGEIRTAIEYYEKALKIVHKISDRRGEGANLSNLGNAYADLGETHKAIDCYEQALKIYREIGDRRNEGADLSNLGLVYANLGETRKTINYHKQALAIIREIGDKRSEGEVLCNLGKAYLDLNETGKAIDYCTQSLDIACKIEYRQIEGQALCTLGKALTSQGELQKALDHCDQAQKIFKDIEYPKGEAEVLFARALALHLLGQYDEATQCAQKALDIFQRIESPLAEKVRQQLADWSSPQEP